MFNYRFRVRYFNEYSCSKVTFPKLCSKGLLNDFDTYIITKIIFDSIFLRNKKTMLKKKEWLFQSKLLLKSRIDIFIRLLVPGAAFLVLKKKLNTFFFFFSTIILWPKEYFDILSLILYSNIFFINTKLFDVTASNNIKKKKINFFLYYIFKVPVFSVWLVVFIELKKITGSSCKGIISIETIFKSAAWAEREVSELFGIFFFFKSSNRKLITDYFFKLYPMLKWVPSIGFSEVFLSSEGFFFNRSVKVFNSSLS